MKFHDFNLTNTGYSNLPSNLVNSMESFLFHGTQPGGFLTAVLNNDLKGAIAKGDLKSRECLPELVIFIYNHFPGRFLRPNSVEEFLQSTIRYRVDDKGYCVSFDTNPINSERYNQDFWSDVNYV